MFSGKRDVALLSLAQAMLTSAISLSFTLAAILGSQLALDKGLATLPVAMTVVGAALASVPAAWVMGRFGRRAAFLMGTAIGVLGSTLAVIGLLQGSFVFFVVAHGMLGIYQGIANYYRYAAAELVDPGSASKAIAWVVGGGLFAAFLGPQLGQWGAHWFGPSTFVGSYVAQGVLSVVAMAAIGLTRTVPVPVVARHDTRPLREILAHPALGVSVIGAAVSYSVMTMAMSATPLAMAGSGLPMHAVTWVIQWHVVGMYAPSFFTGTLIKRFGAPRIMLLGFVLLLGHVAISLSGVGFLHYWSALVMLGIGWNFAYIGGTTLLSQTYRPSETLKMQAFNEVSIFGTVAVATLTAGWLYDRFGWVMLNLAITPFILMALVLALRLHRRTSFVPAEAP